MRKSPEVILGHLRAYGVEFEDLQKETNYRSKFREIKLLTWNFGKSLNRGLSRSFKVKNRENGQKLSNFDNYQNFTNYTIESLKTRKGGRGGARDTHGATCHN